MLGYMGYRGYWAQHFKQVDPHLGTLADYQRLSHGLHSRGWSNALFGPQGASASSDGATITPAASIAADAALRTVTFTIPAAALGDAATLSGARVVVTTWDYDGG